MSKAQKVKEEYLNKYGSFEISYDKTGDIILPYIYTEKFIASPSNSYSDCFNNYEESIKQLYYTVFRNPVAVGKYGYGTIYSEEEFNDMIQEDSFIWQNNAHFAGFIITDKKDDVVVGYERIWYSPENTRSQHAANLCYILNPNYHRSTIIQNVGSECIYAFSEGYCKNLYKQKAPIPRTYDQTNKVFVGESFTKIEATARTDNIASNHILKNLDFNLVGQEFIFNHDRNIYVKDFEAEELLLTGEQSASN